MPTTRKSRAVAISDEPMLSEAPPHSDDDYTEAEDYPDDQYDYPNDPDNKETETVAVIPWNDSAKTSSPEGFEVICTFSRTVQVEQFSPAKAEVTLKESFPGTSNPADIVDLVRSQFQLAKSEVLLQLGLSFTTDEDSGRIMETFEGSRVVASGPAAAPAQRDQAAPPRRPAPTPRPAPRPASRAPQSQSGGARQAPRTPSTQELWGELMAHPELWTDNRDSKTKDTQPDFLSTQHMNDRGYPVGLWVNNRSPYDHEAIDTYMEENNLGFANS